jgi:hypothetical protein
LHTGFFLLGVGLLNRSILLIVGIFFTSGVFAATGINKIPVCYDFGCKIKQLVAISDSEWREISGWFYPKAETAEAERLQIKKAIGWMEVVIGNHTPTHRDTGLDLEFDGVFPGQLDCIDESLNTTTYLRLFETNNLLKHHVVLERAYRRAIFDQHWAGQIMENTTGKKYTVDSWFQRNGILPYVQSLDEWKDIPFFFSSYVDNSREYEDTTTTKKSFWRSMKERIKGKTNPAATSE